jgi:hypothetical protein
MIAKDLHRMSGKSLVIMRAFRSARDNGNKRGALPVPAPGTSG